MIPIAISGKDYSKYGCPKCNCIYRKFEDFDCSYIVSCIECNTKFVVLDQSVNISLFGFQQNEDKDEYIYPKFQNHPNKKRAHYYIRPDKKPDIGEYFKPRGVGYDLAGFVESRISGERIINMFRKILGHDIKTWLDYRDFEPDWIQIKVQKEDGIDLEELCKLTQDGVITEEKILESLKY